VGARLRTPAFAAAISAAWIALAAPAIGGDPRPKPRPPAKRVFVVGDSLAVGTRPYLGRALGGWRIAHSVSVSKHARGGVSELWRKRLAPFVVVSLGTNDDPHAVGSFDHSVRTALRIAGERRCVVWPNIVRPPVGGASYAGYNHVLRRLDERRDNLRVVHWSRMVSRNPQWLADDGVHVNASGYTARARAISRAVKHCRHSL
jgi:lysophospholipase L1-like esterase